LERAVQFLGGIGLEDVQAAYGGRERELWELVMGQQIHIGGFQSSVELAERAAVPPGSTGVDLCCCTGAGMRFLVRFSRVERMVGVDATEAVLELGRRRSQAEGLAERMTFLLADASETGLPDAAFDFVWGEDAWCYVVDKRRLVAEAARLVKAGGAIAFTDWIEGPAGLAPDEAERWMRFMKFPSVASQKDYVDLLETHGCKVVAAEDTGRFAPYVDLYLNMLKMQLGYDALRLLGFDSGAMEAMAAEMDLMRGLAHAGKIAQGRFVARKQ
jgi:SAM-dependent methyltransferase